jgi:hypothetical protein
VAWPQQWCWVCAAKRGIERICDRAKYQDTGVNCPPWWRWTAFVRLALLVEIRDKSIRERGLPNPPHSS